jgi:alginate O-acetyltransferase complex protein AlgI
MLLLTSLALFKYLRPTWLDTYLTVPGLDLGSLPGSAANQVLPLGISFYTFNMLGALFDVYQGRVKETPSLLSFAGYVSFFPTIASGPLIRLHDFNPTDENRTRLGAGKVELGLYGLTIGLAKKVVIADGLGRIIDPLFASVGDLGFWGGWIGTLGYAHQLYFDFSGYSDMAIGLARILGVHVPPNFDAPFTAASLTEFWQRWHITLSHWFRDYFFLPFSRWMLGMHHGLSASVIRTISLVSNMLLIGLWHGATPPFLLWGVLQGVILAAEAHGRRRGWTLPRPLTRSATFLFIILGFILIRSPDMETAFAIYRTLFGLNGYEQWVGGLPQVMRVGRRVLGVLVILTALSQFRWDTWNTKLRRSRGYLLGLALLFLIALTQLGAPRTFIYFQF